MRIFLSVFILVLFFSFTFFCKAEVPIEEKIGQMIMVSFEGESITNNEVLKDQIRSGMIGGVVLFSENIKNPGQLKNLTNEIKQCDAKHPLFIAVDQEGGKVLRLSNQKGFVNFPSAQKVADIKTVDESYSIYKNMANILFAAGINTNFAPVCDLNINPNSSVLGKRKRCFSDNPFVVVQYADAFIRAHHDQHVMTVIKHYPGHGSASGDTHDGMVDVTNNWNEKEMVPFAALIKNSMVDMVMIAHIVDKNVDMEYPASLSKKHIQKKLREKLGYGGVVITDDLQMLAIKKNYSFEHAIIQAVNAGCDLLLFANAKCDDPYIAYKVKQVIVNAIQEGKIKVERINEAYRRIMKLKKKYFFNKQ